MFREESLTYKQSFKRSVVFSDFCSAPICSVVQTFIVKQKTNLKVSLFVFNSHTVFSFCLLF